MTKNCATHIDNNFSRLRYHNKFTMYQKIPGSKVGCLVLLRLLLLLPMQFKPVYSETHPVLVVMKVSLMRCEEKISCPIWNKKKKKENPMSLLKEELILPFPRQKGKYLAYLIGLDVICEISIYKRQKKQTLAVLYIVRMA